MLKPERSRPSISSPSKSRKSIVPESPTAGKIKAFGLQHATSGERHPWDEQTRPSGCEPAQDASFVVEVTQCVACWLLVAHSHFGVRSTRLQCRASVPTACCPQMALTC